MANFSGNLPDSSSDQAYYLEHNDTTMEQSPNAAPAWLQQFLNTLNERMQRLENNIPASTAPISPPEEAPVPKDKRPRPKLPDPERFNGDDTSLYPQFEGKLRAKLTIDAAAIGSEKDRIWYGFSRLEGKAGARIYPWMETYQANALTFTLENFYKQLRSAFRDAAQQDKALAKLNSLRQSNRPFNDLLSDLDRLLLEAGGHGWDDKVKKGYLRAAISQSLREQLIAVKEEESYDEYCQQVKEIADRMMEFKRIASARTYGAAHQYTGTIRQRTPVNQPASRNAPTPALVGDPMDWQPSAARSSAPNINTTNKRAKHVSEEEIESRKRTGRCLRCGAHGHRIRECPYLPPVRPTLKVAEAEVAGPQLDDDEKEEEQLKDLLL
jgi:hypothetical protein